MKRKFKPGDRARIVNSKDAGKIVVVVRKYRGEEIGGATWHEEVFPWVVTSLGGLLSCCVHSTKAPLPPVMTVVIDDRDLEPLPEDGDQSDEDVELNLTPPARHLVESI